MELRGEDLLCYFNKIQSGWFKKMSVWSLTCEQSVFKRHRSSKHFRVLSTKWRRKPASMDTYIHMFNGPLSETTRVSRYQKGKTNLDFTEARDSEWQWHQLGYMQVCTSLQTDNHASTPPLSFLQAGCPSCRPANSVKALKARKAPQLNKTWRGSTAY